MDWTAPLSVLFPPVQGAVLHALWRYPGPSTGRRVHAVSGVGSHAGTAAALRRLSEQGVVLARPVGSAVEYSLNPDHVMWPVIDAAMVAFHPRDRLTRNLRQLLEEQLGETAKRSTAAYFGSFARGAATADSDIDVLLLLPDDLDDDRTDVVVAEVEGAGRRWSGNEVQVYALKEKALRNAVAHGDPIVDSWLADAEPLLGVPIAKRVAEHRRSLA